MVINCRIKSSDNPSIRLFTWKDLHDLYDVMSRAGNPPYTCAKNPKEALAADLRHPRTNPLSDVYVAETNKSIFGWLRLSFELNIGRVTATIGTDPACAEKTLWANLLDMAITRAREARIKLLHVAITETQRDFISTAKALGLKQSRVYYSMEYRPAPVYLRGDYRPLPEGYRLRPMNENEIGTLTDLQNMAFENSWGYAPNTVEETSAWLMLPGTGAEYTLFAVDNLDRAIAYTWTKFDQFNGTKIGYIAMVGVHPKYQRSGLGGAIVSASIRNLRNKGVSLIKLEVDSTNRAACRLYRDLGFKRVSKTTWHELKLDTQS